MLNILKYPRYLSKMIKTNSPLVCPLCFFVIFAVLGFSCRHCSSLHKTDSKQHTRISTVSISEAVCVQKILPIGNFSATVKALWSFHPHKCLVFENPRTLRWKWAFFTANSTTASFCAPCDIVIGHGRGRGLGPRSNFTRPKVIQSINVHYLPHPLSELSSCCIVPINQ